MNRELSLFTYNDPKSPISEVFRTLRTNIKYASFDKDVKTIVFTSPGPNEGKSTIAANYAVTLSNAGNKVLLMDCDLRNPSMHKIFKLANQFGLANQLLKKCDYENSIQHTFIEGLDILASGPKPPNPAELLGSDMMKDFLNSIRDDYDYILLDTPPIVMVTDAALLASFCDATILVISSGETLIEAAVKAKDLLLNVNANIIGTVLSKCKHAKFCSSYYGYYYGEKNSRRKVDG